MSICSECSQLSLRNYAAYLVLQVVKLSSLIRLIRQTHQSLAYFSEKHAISLSLIIRGEQVLLELYIYEIEIEPQFYPALSHMLALAGIGEN